MQVVMDQQVTNIYVNISSGSMTISIDGGSTPSIRTAGATVTVENS